MKMAPLPQPDTDRWLIRGAELADPSTGAHGRRDVLIEAGRVAEVAESIAPQAAARRCAAPLALIDADGLWLWPGLVDLHVHFREPGFTRKETIASGGAAAARGGYTTVVCEPNTLPPIDSPALVRELAAKAAAESPVRVYFKAAMTAGRAGERVSDIEALVREPSVAALSDDGDPVTRIAVMEEVCRRAARVGIPLSPHCEDSPRALAECAAGADCGFQRTDPYRNEAGYIERDIALARRWGCRVHFSHVSLAQSVEVLRKSRQECPAAGITFEVAPHHLLLSAADYAAGAAPTVVPPLRSPADRQAVQDALTDGLADAVASDHAPHTAEDKAKGATGLIGLETTLGLMLTHFVHTGRLGPLAAARVMSTRPAEILGLAAGSLAPGRAADAVLIDPNEQWRVRAEESASLSRNTPYDGWSLRGRAVGVLVAGRMVFQRDSLRDRLRS